MRRPVRIVPILIALLVSAQSWFSSAHALDLVRPNDTPALVATGDQSTDEDTPLTVTVDAPDVDGETVKEIQQRIKPSTDAKPANLPPAALVGNLDRAQEILAEGQHLESARETLNALEQRPFHPEAWLHLAEVALAVGLYPRLQEKKDLSSRLPQMFSILKKTCSMHWRKVTSTRVT